VKFCDAFKFWPYYKTPCFVDVAPFAALSDRTQFLAKTANFLELYVNPHIPGPIDESPPLSDLHCCKALRKWGCIGVMLSPNDNRAIMVNEMPAGAKFPAARENEEV
jgi:hypothetical protein